MRSSSTSRLSNFGDLAQTDPRGPVPRVNVSEGALVATDPRGPVPRVNVSEGALVATDPRGPVPRVNVLELDDDADFDDLVGGNVEEGRRTLRVSRHR